MLEGNLPEEWYCNVCYARNHRLPQDEDGESGFGLLLRYLEGKNPSAFCLPEEVRGYFVNVKTGDEGQYEEGGATKPKYELDSLYLR